MRLRTKIAVTFSLLLASVLVASTLTMLAAHRNLAQAQAETHLAHASAMLSRLIEADQRELLHAALAAAADPQVRDAEGLEDAQVRERLSRKLRDAHASAALLVMPASPIGPARAVTTGRDAAMASALLADEAVTRGGNQPRVLVRKEQSRALQLAIAPLKNGGWLGLAAAIDAADLAAWSRLTDSTVTISLRGGAQALDARQTLSKQIALGEADSAPAITLVLTPARIDTALSHAAVSLIGIALAGFALFALAAHLLARHLTSPLRELTDAVDRIRLGKYSTPLAVDRADELGELAKGLHVMHSAVQSRDQEIHQLAYEDLLTRLMNRTAFVQALERALAKRRTGGVVVAIIDVERFRRINECLGYGVGDEVLKTIAARLNAHPREADAVARLAADQFAAFAHLSPGNTVQNWGASLLTRFQDAILVQSQPIDVTGTVGLAIAPIHASSAGELMRCAELALERARDAKRALTIYEAAFKPIARDQLSLLGDLQRAIDEDQLVLHFQPKLEFATRRIAGVEVLMRWRHPTRGLLMPSEFIPFAEQTGFIRRITRWLLDRAVAQASTWHRQGDTLPIAVNISAEDIADPLLDQRVSAALARHELPPSLLTLEVTESGFIEDPARALRMLEALAALGVRLSIDDFGTGYSSLSYLARMPVDEVKIDHSFVQGLESDQDFAAIVRAAIDMGHSLGLKVVAEGIENEMSAARLREMGCDLAQGFLFAKPMSLGDLKSWLEGRERLTVLTEPAQFHAEDTEAGLLEATNMFRIPRSFGTF